MCVGGRGGGGQVNTDIDTLTWGDLVIETPGRLATNPGKVNRAEGLLTTLHLEVRSVGDRGRPDGIYSMSLNSNDCILKITIPCL